MNYAYDILLNYKDRYYDFYDWNKNDSIIHIRKIPIFKISTEKLLDIKNNNIILDKDFLNLIENKTEVFTKKGIDHLKYACLFMNDELVVGINNKRISSLLIDEELDILEEFYAIDEVNIKYKIINNIEEELKTRKQIEIDKKVNKELKYIEDNKLKYLYYECFDKKENDIEKIRLDFKQSNNKIKEKLFNIFKLIEIKK